MDFGNATRIGVVIRMRPLLEEEEKAGHPLGEVGAEVKVQHDDLTCYTDKSVLN